MSASIRTLLLLALPASGKSEVRRYLAQLEATGRADALGLGPTVQLDDYPYVHLMRRVDEERSALGAAPVFFAGRDRPFVEPRDWGTLSVLLDQDFAALARAPAAPPASCAQWLFERIDAARTAVGAGAPFAALAARERGALADRLEREARALFDERAAGPALELAGRTVVVEFARGGPAGAPLPLPAPHGYAYSLACLSDELLASAAILYVWVTPEESRRKNRERARPGREGEASILHHGVPEEVMLREYALDDVEHLIATGPRPGTVRIEARGRSFVVPIARFDNRVDRTSFLRDEPGTWSDESVRGLHAELERALAALR